jgi:pimeloyl-ACP methyl ester carboxylesterase
VKYARDSSSHNRPQQLRIKYLETVHCPTIRRGPFDESQGPLVSTNPKIVILKNTGHWLMEENPTETMNALLGFL